MICTGPCCNKDDSARLLLNELKNRLLAAIECADRVGEASCVRRSCLGKCTGEPLAYVHPDGVWYHNLSVDNLMLILTSHVLNEQPVDGLILDDDS